MKKMLVFVAIVSLMAGSLFAEEEILIDFSKLAADIHVSLGDDDTGTEPNQNRHTMMDFANVRFVGSFTEDQKKVMKTSLAIANWEVLLASSARTVTNMVLSHTKEADSKQFGTVMGVRVRFPVEAYHSWAVIKPPYEIPAYEPPVNVGDDGTIDQPTDEEARSGVTGRDANGERVKSRFEDGFGVVKNVGTIKSLAVNVYGLNFPHGLNILTIDELGNQRSMFMGYLAFDGWGELRWDNPQYIQEVRNRDLRIIPLYPDAAPFIKFAGFEIKRDGSRQGGDFITYFKDVKVIFDKAVFDSDRDIEDEALWGIIYDREHARKVWQMERFGQNQILRYIDSQKQAVESSFTPTPKSTDDQ